MNQDGELGQGPECRISLIAAPLTHLSAKCQRIACGHSHALALTCRFCVAFNLKAKWMVVCTPGAQMAMDNLDTTLPPLI